MKIVLRVDGQEKTYKKDFVEGIVFRKALELNKKIRESGKIGEVETYDEYIDFIVFAFGNQFTSEDAWNGLSVAQIQTEPTRIFTEVLSLGGLATHQADEGEEGNETGK
ncbi:phage tail assembly chaperone G [Psychrobacillus antarcticus]|uniref:phage tail assembly chaperone G n=1 Tax=Psychrobacillus antarcticus TaxID=2879115 RepID=UPI0024083393|nr:hypothetical protein [Psychrobacillus antarcticus]